MRALRRILEHRDQQGYVTKVIRTGRYELAWLLMACVAATLGWSQDKPNPDNQPGIRALGKAPPLQLHPAESLYLQLRGVGLDKSRVYHVRDLSIDRSVFHITLDNGTIAFTEDVAGRVTGAFFEGDGEVLFVPPDEVERGSMALFTGAAILEERFVTAYFRFNDDTFHELQPSFRPAEQVQEFVSQWNESAHILAESDALRLFMSFSQSLPVGQEAEEPQATNSPTANADRFLHVHLQGRKLGIFDLYFDSNAPEQIWAGQLKTVEDGSYYDVWSSSSLAQTGGGSEAVNSTTGEGGKAGAIDISHYRIRAEIKPPTQIDAETVLQLEVRQGGQRAVLFELSRALQIRQIEADGQSVEFIHNPAIEGTQLARHGNDLVAVVFPQPLRTGQRLELRFVYGGEVLSEAGAGLLYVGARGTWYPSRGLAMSDFDLEFHYPSEWTLVATGKRVDASASTLLDNHGAAGTPVPGEQVSRWVSERPIPVAGFNLGKFERALAHAGAVTIETYATAGVERGFPKPAPEAVLPPSGAVGAPQAPLIISSAPPSPARNAQKVADASARAIEFFSPRFGPYPYSELALTQIPGALSQGWPGLIFLSSYSFLTGDEKSQLHMSSVEKTLITQVIAHETAHQWWGDLVTWNSYRDQWIIEALANYSSMMLLESEDPAQFHAAMEKYRDDLLEKNKAGVALLEDGPVTLGTRLSCSRFPSGYEAISYGRGTWLLHMLRSMLRDAEPKSAHVSGADGTRSTDEPFVRALRRMRQCYQGKAITTHELLQSFEEELPRSLWYEGRKSLDWFYQGWVNGSAIPRFELRTVKYYDKPGSTTVSGLILQKNAPEDLVTSVPVYASEAGKMVLLGRVFADGPETRFRLTAPAGARRVVLDPYQTLLARTR